MADGNFNTKILAPGGYASGVRAGEARMKQRALALFAHMLDELPGLSEERQSALKQSFKEGLDTSTLGK